MRAIGQRSAAGILQRPWSICRLGRQCHVPLPVPSWRFLGRPGALWRVASVRKLCLRCLHEFGRLPPLVHASCCEWCRCALQPLSFGHENGSDLYTYPEIKRRQHHTRLQRCQEWKNMQSLLTSSETRNPETSVATNACSRAALVSVRLLVVLMLGILANGCEDAATTWSAEVRSPDGQWLAIAQTKQWSGPGTAYDATVVSLRHVNASSDPTEVLLFSHQYPRMSLKMEWLTPTHLDVAYGASGRPGDHVSLDFQVAKMSGVDISARDVSNGASERLPVSGR